MADARVDILDEASEELERICVDLEVDEPGLSRRFITDYLRKLRQIAQFPESGPRIEGTPHHFEVRSFLLKSKYRVIVATLNGVRTVVAVAHPKKDPNYWRDRLPDVPP